ncbi:CLUMA_CG001070, isoform A [Clunio marinus]|uniref:CLUMA_CG001070, isoform A n=1 Tax=Clunio marinus TaxID=568069 RepID=A0A1J1HIP3_9DIPT|nr:CLUMA_CG001070, isoform A [Clunio marinus]
MKKMMMRVRRQVPHHSCSYVIFIALVYVIRLTQSAITVGSLESLEGDLKATTLSTPSSLISLPCIFTSNTTLDCSKQKLSAIPKDLPIWIESLNLSFNNFDDIKDDMFYECCRNVKVLDLSHNDISELQQRHFKNLNNLEVLLLGDNKISTLEPEVFQGLTKMKRLSLKNNPLELRRSSSKGFLIQSSLEELNLDNCELKEIPDGTFNNMRQLRILTLAGNPLDEFLDLTAFEQLTNLIKLRIPNLTQATIYELCNKLIAIDVVNFDEFNITCLVLADDGAFEDSVITNDPVGEPKSASVLSYELPMAVPKSTLPTTTVTASTTSTSSPSQATNSDKKLSTSTTEAINVVEASNEIKINQTEPETTKAAIDIDNETIKYILIGIFTITLLGIIIGLICRADACGIKTKCCRTNKKDMKNRREPEDTVSPFEEIPLNSVTVKTTNNSQA